jgi:hypothetical protein
MITLFLILSFTLIGLATGYYCGMNNAKIENHIREDQAYWLGREHAFDKTLKHLSGKARK